MYLFIELEWFYIQSNFHNYFGIREKYKKDSTIVQKRTYMDLNQT